MRERYNNNKAVIFDCKLNIIIICTLILHTPSENFLSVINQIIYTRPLIIHGNCDKVLLTDSTWKILQFSNLQNKNILLLSHLFHVILSGNLQNASQDQASIAFYLLILRFRAILLVR